MQIRLMNLVLLQIVIPGKKWYVKADLYEYSLFLMKDSLGWNFIFIGKKEFMAVSTKDINEM